MRLYRQAAVIDLVVPADGSRAPKPEKFTEYFYDSAVRGACRCNRSHDKCKCKQPEIKGGRATPNVARPTMADLRCDVDLIIKTVVPKEWQLPFWQAYVYYDADDPIDIEVHADKVYKKFGANRHQIEQRLGQVFIRKGLFPTKRYFTVIRQEVQG